MGHPIRYDNLNKNNADDRDRIALTMSKEGVEQKRRIIKNQRGRWIIVYNMTLLLKIRSKENENYRDRFTLTQSRGTS